MERGGGVHFHGPVSLYPRSFDEFVQQISEKQEAHGSQRRRNVHKAKTR